jgi:hypothetical protein
VPTGQEDGRPHKTALLGCQEWWNTPSLIIMSSVQQLVKKRKASVGDSHKKAKAATVPNNNSTTKFSEARAALHAESDFSPYSLHDIHDRIQALCRQLPVVPVTEFLLENDITTDDASSIINPTRTHSNIAARYDKTAVRTWATGVQTVLEEFHLLVACVSPATYVWGTDRSGAADQSLQLLSGELVRSQEQLLSRVAPKLNDVLAPVVTLLNDRTVTTKHIVGSNGEGEMLTTTTATSTNTVVETKQNYFITAPEDPDYVDLCLVILARSAPLLRKVVLANLDKVMRAMEDYLQAKHKDSQHDARGFVY